MKRFRFCIIMTALLPLAINAKTTKWSGETLFDFDKTIPSYINLTENRDYKLSKYGTIDKYCFLKSLLEVSEETTFELVDTLTDIAGGYHESFREYYRGLEIVGTRGTIHYNRYGDAVSITDNFRYVTDVSTKPLISKSQATITALSFMKNELLQSVDKEYSETVLSALLTEEPLVSLKDALVICFVDDTPHVSYLLDVSHKEMMMSKRIYVDVATGEVVLHENRVFDITTKVKTYYYADSVNIETYYDSPYYELKDYTRGNGIETYEYGGGQYLSSDNKWNLPYYQRVALDAHWGMEMTYDFFYNQFGRNSYDNNGSIIKCYVNKPYTNQANWVDLSIVCGKNGDVFWVGTDIIAHEYSHGFTGSTSNLTYQGESGALNEGMSDVFATCVENYAKPNNGYMIWLCGEDEVSGGLRDMRNPNCNFYQGQGWVDTSAINNDYGGVHTNSGVFNYWFYLLANGGNGTNEAGYQYSVSGIGLDDAVQICYLMNAAYLNSNSTFLQARQYSKIAANQLGYNNSVIAQIEEAWKAVGICDISGPTVLCSSNVFTLDCFPSDCTVTWSISGSIPSSLTLTQNSPYNNQCTITRSGYAEFNYITLCASIVRNGVTLRTLTKKIYRDNFSGTYEEGTSSYNGHDYPAISQTNITNRSATYVYINGTVTLYSDYFVNKDLSTSGPYAYFSHVPENRVRFSLSSSNLSQPFTITIPASGCDDEVRLTFYAITPYLNYNLNIIPRGSQTYELSVTRNVVEGDMEAISETVGRTQEDNSAEKESSRLIDEPWTLEVTNAVSGRNALSREMDEPVYILNTAGWEPGVYVVRAIVGKESLTGKITVK